MTPEMKKIFGAIILQLLGLYHFCIRQHLERNAFEKAAEAGRTLSERERKFNLICISIATILAAVVGMVLLVRAVGATSSFVCAVVAAVLNAGIITVVLIRFGGRPS